MRRSLPSPATGRIGALVVGTALSVVVAGLLSGCGGASGGTATAPSSSSADSLGTVTTAPDGVQEVTIHTQDNYVFTPDHFTVKPGNVRLTVANVGTQLSHNFRFTPDKGPAPIGAQILLLTSGQRKTIEFSVPTPGDYPFQCSFHVDLGQVGTMTVNG
jgi:plastocyanin